MIVYRQSLSFEFVFATVLELLKLDKNLGQNSRYFVVNFKFDHNILIDTVSLTSMNMTLDFIT